MSDQVVNLDESYGGSSNNLLLIKQISWAAVFAGALVALGVEVLFLSFGLFIGFRMSPTGASVWSAIWFWIGCFFSLMAGGWVASRLGGNPVHGKVHGLVTWGLATVTTFAFLTAMSWGVAKQSLDLVRTATLATAEAAPVAANRIPANEANRVQEEANAAVNQAPAVAQAAAHDISRVSLVLWIGFMIAACGAIVGGSIGAPKLTAAARRTA